MREIIEQMIKEELAEANSKYKPFTSVHEAYAVTLEELDETDNELTNAYIDMHEAWTHCKRDDINQFIASIQNVRKDALRIIEEAVQLAAMCDKAIPLAEGKEPFLE